MKTMSNKPLIVRFVQAAEKPTLPKVDYEITIDTTENNNIFAKPAQIIAGSSLGLVAGFLIFFMLKSTGVDLGQAESSFVIGLPAVLGVISSLVIC